MIASTTPRFDIKTLVTRPEVLTLILAVVVSALAASPLPVRAGLDVPQEALTQTITAFWAVFLGALFEGKRHPARDFFANHFVADGDLITGQNQNAGPMVARLMMQRVLDKRSLTGRVAS